MATQEERRAFGQRLRGLREEADLTQDALADQLKDLGIETTGANIGAWENGRYSPRQRATVYVLEQFFKASGELAPLLGITSGQIRDRLVLEERSAGHEGIQLSADGVILDDLRDEDPQFYEHLMQSARLALEAARARQGGGS